MGRKNLGVACLALDRPSNALGGVGKQGKGNLQQSAIAFIEEQR